MLVAVCAAALYGLWLDQRLQTELEGGRWMLPARIHARPLELYPGASLPQAAVAAELERLGYAEVSAPQRPGQYAREGSRLRVHTRRFAFWDGIEPARLVTVAFGDDTVTAVRSDGDPRGAVVRLDPLEIGRIYPSHQEDRVLVRLAEVPPALIEALVAIEDRRFRQHHGVDPRAIARALWANVQAGRTVQGGSTLTQQLVKNFFLGREQTLARKLEEAFMALLLERRYSKDEILEAYLNEVFLGQHGRRAIHGFGLAARFYFRRPLEELELPELALLAGLAKGASYYNPRKHPERARQRRDLVIAAMVDEGFLSPERGRRAREAPLGVSADPGFVRSPYPAFLDLVREQLARDYRDSDLRSEGLQVFTTLDPMVQAQAEAALGDGIADLEKRRGLPAGRLQGAAVVTDTDTGEVLALVGGRDPRAAGFNRALNARRPIGSLVKPAVYLAAFRRDGGYTPASIVEDAAVRLEDAEGKPWAPRNFDRREHGEVLLADALVHSYNLATVRLGLSLGLRKVVRTLSDLGLPPPPDPYPSLLLGAVEASPAEVAHMYQTLAAGGFRSPLRAIREVTAPDGEALARYRLHVEQAVAPGPVYLVDRVLQEVMTRGTGSTAASRLGKELTVAGKTGTTDDLRDSWLAGFGGSRLAVIWLGRDDNRPAGLTGGSGAGRVWGDLMAAVETRGWSPPVPESVAFHWVGDDGGRVEASCPGARRLAFLRDRPPPRGACGGRAPDPGQPEENGLWGFDPW